MALYSRRVYAKYVFRRVFPAGVRGRLSSGFRSKLRRYSVRKLRPIARRQIARVYWKAKKRGWISKRNVHRFKMVRKAWKRGKYDILVGSAAGAWSLSRRRGPGRPPSLKSTAASSQPKRPVGRPKRRRRPGRPKGSRAKKGVVKTAYGYKVTATRKKRRSTGRPVGRPRTVALLRRAGGGGKFTIVRARSKTGRVVRKKRSDKGKKRKPRGRNLPYFF